MTIHCQSMHKLHLLVITISLDLTISLFSFPFCFSHHIFYFLIISFYMFYLYLLFYNHAQIGLLIPSILYSFISIFMDMIIYYIKHKNCKCMSSYTSSTMSPNFVCIADSMLSLYAAIFSRSASVSAMSFIPA